MLLNSLCHDWTGLEALLTCSTFSSQSRKKIGQKGPLEIIWSNLLCHLGLNQVTSARSGQPWLYLCEPWKAPLMKISLSPWGNNGMNLLQCCAVLLMSPNLPNWNLCLLPLVTLSVSVEKSFDLSPLWHPFTHSNCYQIAAYLFVRLPSFLIAHWWPMTDHSCLMPQLSCWPSDGPSPVSPHPLQNRTQTPGMRWPVHLTDRPSAQAGLRKQVLFKHCWLLSSWSSFPVLGLGTLKTYGS